MSFWNPLPMFALLVASGTITASAERPQLQCDADVSQTGYYHLSWEPGGDGVIFELQESSSPDFEDGQTLYRGSQSATVLSGRRDGAYHYRLRREGGPWSETVIVTVAHHNLTNALIYMGVGSMVFLATATLIVRGHIIHRREESGA